MTGAARRENLFRRGARWPVAGRPGAASLLASGDRPIAQTSFSGRGDARLAVAHSMIMYVYLSLQEVQLCTAVL